jgi:hypothetical protein
VSAQRSAAIAAAICTAAAIAHPVNAGAATSTVSPGDEIEHIEIDGGSHVCTLGYTYTTDGATYGVTAGHFNDVESAVDADNWPFLAPNVVDLDQIRARIRTQRSRLNPAPMARPAPPHGGGWPGHFLSSGHGRVNVVALRATDEQPTSRWAT